jgi:hypothetical protein
MQPITKRSDSVRLKVALRRGVACFNPDHRSNRTPPFKISKSTITKVRKSGGPSGIARSKNRQMYFRMRGGIFKPRVIKQNGQVEYDT